MTLLMIVLGNQDASRVVVWVGWQGDRHALHDLC